MLRLLICNGVHFWLPEKEQAYIVYIGIYIYTVASAHAQ